MKRAGGIVAVLAGVSGIIVTGYEIFRLMRDEDFMALSYANDVLVYGWGTVAFFAAIAGLGAVAARAKGRLVAIPVILCAIAPPFLLGVGSVIVFAVQAVMGALIVLFGKDSRQDARPPAP